MGLPFAGAARQYLGARHIWLTAAAVLLGVAAFLNWGWLVASGVAPVLLAAAPCAAMCAIGLCMDKAADKSCGGALKDRVKALESKAGRE